MGRRGPETTWALDRNREQVVGLRERKDGRFYAIGQDGSIKTFGRDRDEAVRRFHAWDASRQKKTVRFTETKQKSGWWNQEYEYQESTVVSERLYWDRVSHDLRVNPKLAAAKTGIEQLAYLTDLQPPAPSTSLAAIGQRYIDDKKNLTGDEWNNSATWWNEFIKLTGAKTVAELNHDALRTYRDEIKSQQKIPTKRKNGKTIPKSNSWTRSRFGKIKTIINHALTEMDIPTADRQTLSLMRILKNPPKPTSRPVDIERDELEKILDHADDFDTALILTALNCCFGAKDVCRLRWDMLDLRKGTLCFDRDKSEHLAGAAIVRVAVLWRRTMEALEKIRKDDTHVFLSREGLMDEQTPNHRFKKILKRAGIQRKLTFINLRDSAQTRAAEMGVPMQAYRVLSGHKIGGVDDDYIRRNPNFVAPACEGIERYYFGKP